MFTLLGIECQLNKTEQELEYDVHEVNSNNERSNSSMSISYPEPERDLRYNQIMHHSPSGQRVRSSFHASRAFPSTCHATSASSVIPSPIRSRTQFDQRSVSPYNRSWPLGSFVQNTPPSSRTPSPIDFSRQFEGRLIRPWPRHGTQFYQGHRSWALNSINLPRQFDGTALSPMSVRI